MSNSVQPLMPFDIKGLNIAIQRPSFYCDNQALLASSQNESIPAGANFVKITSDGDTYITMDGATVPVVPAGSVTNGSAPMRVVGSVPTMYEIAGLAGPIKFISSKTGYVTFEYSS
jgi:hypothetical protein